MSVETLTVEETKSTGGALRDKYEEALAQNKAYEARIAALEANASTAARTSAVLAAGLPERVVNLIPQDADPVAWVEANRDLFPTATTVPAVTALGSATSRIDGVNATTVTSDMDEAATEKFAQLLAGLDPKAGFAGLERALKTV